MAKKSYHVRAVVPPLRGFASTGGVNTSVMRWRDIYMHPATNCAGQHCAIHAPSGHKLNRVAIVVRLDHHERIDRLCVHGDLHPDPDSVAYLRTRVTGSVALVSLGHHFNTKGARSTCICGCCGPIDNHKNKKRKLAELAAAKERDLIDQQAREQAENEHMRRAAKYITTSGSNTYASFNWNPAASYYIRP